MGRGEKLTFLLILLAVCSFAAGAETLLDKIEYTTNPDTYFTNIMVPVLSWSRWGYKEGDGGGALLGSYDMNIVGYDTELAKVYPQLPANEGEDYFGNSLAGALCLPVFTPSFLISAFLLVNADDLTRSSFIYFGGGLIYHHSKIGSLGVFGGYLIPDIGYENKEEMHFNVVPLLVTEDYPIINKVLKKIAGYYGYEENKSVNFAVQPYFNEWHLGPLFLEYGYYRDQHYDLFRRSRDYGGKGGLMFEVVSDAFLIFALEGGRREFYDFNGPAYFFYDDTYFARFTVELSTGPESDLPAKVVLGADFDQIREFSPDMFNDWSPNFFLEANIADFLYSRARLYQMRSSWVLDLTVSCALPFF
ncbi:hypothetical protein AGMMS49928_23580 [Spirochaetia bacterium]|nr:hypothetical protein AGMMS49928_23580 [Spirochaetia bacterium]